MSAKDATMPVDDEFDVEIIPDTIQLGHDADGLPKTEPVEKEEKPQKAELVQKPVIKAKVVDDVDADALRRQAFEAQLARDAATREVATEREARVKAEQRADTRETQALRAHWEGLSARQSHYTSVIGSAKSEIASAKQELNRAMAAGEHDNLGDLHERIAIASADLRNFEQGKYTIDNQIKEVERAAQAMAEAKAQPQEPDKKQDAQPATPPTPEQWIANCPKTTQPWLLEHKEFVTDPKLNRKLLRFSEEFMDDHGQHSLDSPKFLEALNERFFPKAEEEPAIEHDVGEEEVEVEEKPKRASAKPAAPVSRGAAPLSSGSQKKPGQIRLTRSEEITAYGMFPNLSPKDALRKYDANKQKLKADGYSVINTQE